MTKYPPDNDLKREVINLLQSAWQINHPVLKELRRTGSRRDTIKLKQGNLAAELMFSPNDFSAWFGFKDFSHADRIAERLAKLLSGDPSLFDRHTSESSKSEDYIYRTTRATTLGRIMFEHWQKNCETERISTLDRLQRYREEIEQARLTTRTSNLPIVDQPMVSMKQVGAPGSNLIPTRLEKSSKNPFLPSPRISHVTFDRESPVVLSVEPTGQQKKNGSRCASASLILANIMFRRRELDGIRIWVKAASIGLRDGDLARAEEANVNLVFEDFRGSAANAEVIGRVEGTEKVVGSRDGLLTDPRWLVDRVHLHPSSDRISVTDVVLGNLAIRYTSADDPVDVQLIFQAEVDLRDFEIESDFAEELSEENLAKQTALDRVLVNKERSGDGRKVIMSRSAIIIEPENTLDE